TNVFASFPSLTTQSSAVKFGLLAEHCTSADVSIFFSSGAAPVKAILPVMLPSLPFAVYALPEVSEPVSSLGPLLLHDEANDNRLRTAIKPSHTRALLLNIFDSSRIQLVKICVKHTLGAFRVPTIFRYRFTR